MVKEGVVLRNIEGGSFLRSYLLTDSCAWAWKGAKADSAHLGVCGRFHDRLKQSGARPLGLFMLTATGLTDTMAATDTLQTL